MTYKARDLIKGSMRLIGAIAPGETPSAAELSDALYTLNQLLASWSTESLMIQAKVREEFPLVAGKGRYTFGPTGDFDSTRPVRIENALIVLDSTSPFSELQLDIVTKEQFAAIKVKNLQSSIPTELYAEGTSPLEAVNIWPIPSVSRTLVIYSAKALDGLTADTALTFGPGYERAIRYNLAIELAPEYGKAVTPEVANSASEAKANVKTLNSKPQYLSSDAALLPRRTGFNYLTGE